MGSPFLPAAHAQTEAPQEAAAEGEEPPPEALEFFEAGRAHYEAGRYSEAAASLEQALALDPNSATLVFNLARIYELLGELDRAITYGHRYRGMMEHDPEEMARADATLRRLEGARDYLAMRQANEAPELRTMESRIIVHERGVVDTAFWAVLGTGAGLLVGGAVLGGLATKRNNEANDLVAADSADQSRRADLRDEADSFALTADILLGAGAATSVAALLLYVLRTRSYERTVESTEALQLQFQVTPQQAAMTMGGTF